MSIGDEKSIYYFDYCGESNTEQVLQLVKERAKEMEIEKIVVASETGLSALKAVDLLDGFSIIVVTSALGSRVENTGLGDLLIGISDATIFQNLQKTCTVIRGTDPFHNINAPFREMTNEKIIRAILHCISSGVGVCMLSVMMATDQGVLTKGERVISCGGSFLGLDTACVVRASNSVDLFTEDGLIVEEIVCKPRNPKYEWPISQDRWRGDLNQYRRFMRQE
ncbi:MAG: hypothetical protein HXS52_09430 [Theionarchaea archaeon]|nr:hypothetical protein [Theionarchaea archaeon]MBU7038143.1 hypothetical protein [Theionarchaea archaeon]